MRSHFGERCLRPIRATTKLKEAPAQACSIFEHAPDSHAAADYQRVVDRIITGRTAETDGDADLESEDTRAMTG